MKLRWLACVALGLCAAVAYAQVPGGPGTPPGPRSTPAIVPGAGVKWDYSVKTKDELAKLGGGELGVGLNTLGEEGWELVSVEPRAAEIGRGSTFYFKRSRGHLPAAGMSMSLPGMGGPPNTGGFSARGGGAGGMAGRGGAGPVPPHTEEIFQIFRLKYAKAAPTAGALKELYGDRSGVRCVSDERTNSLLVAAPEEQLLKMAAILVKLDCEVPEEKGKK
jgi:hypothetical protein